LFDFVIHPHISNKLLQLSGELGLEGVLEGDGIGGEFGDTLTELLNGHLVLVEVEAEEGLVIDVGLLLKVEGRGSGGVELLGNGVGGVDELLEQVGLEMELAAVEFDNTLGP
jgi:hypothetical protein